MTTFLAPFVYNAVVLSVHDGDTINVRWDWGRRRYDDPQPIRLLGCSARELKEPGGIEARDNLAALLPVGTPVTLTTAKDDKFAPRVDAYVSYAGPDGVLVDLTSRLIQTGWAAPWDGNGPAPKPAWPRVV